MWQPWRRLQFGLSLMFAVAAFPAPLACETGRMADISDASGKWVLESVAGKPVEGGSKIFFQIDGEMISGFDGCNRFSGRVDQVATLRRTQRGCPPEVFQIRLAKAQDALNALDWRAGSVVLPAGDGGELVTFRRVETE